MNWRPEGFPEYYEVGLPNKNGDKLDNRIENLELMSSIIQHMPSANHERYLAQIKQEAYERGQQDMLEALRSEIKKRGGLKSSKESSEDEIWQAAYSDEKESHGLSSNEVLFKRVARAQLQKILKIMRKEG